MAPGVESSRYFNPRLVKKGPGGIPPGAFFYVMLFFGAAFRSLAGLRNTSPKLCPYTGLEIQCEPVLNLIDVLHAFCCRVAGCGAFVEIARFEIAEACLVQEVVEDLVSRSYVDFRT